MAFRIELSPSALRDAQAIVEYIAADSPKNAYRWRSRLFQLIGNSALFPRGCSLAPESEYCSAEIRQIIFGRYRILFTMRDDESLVHVLTIRHGSRRFMTSEEIDDIE